MLATTLHEQHEEVRLIAKRANCAQHRRGGQCGRRNGGYEAGNAARGMGLTRFTRGLQLSVRYKASPGRTGRSLSPGGL